ncbi:MAG TPA: tRNA modification GTPase [Kofleriaceae bacterium]|nr:tRNA modification GTPase [Kofleriaceae bacterium]
MVDGVLAIESDTIAAIATPAGVGGVGVIRVSGPGAAAIVGEVIGRPSEELPDRQLVLGVARAPDGTRLDQVLAVVMRAPRSYTGEDVGELHGHGGAWNMARLLRAVTARGARHAEPGEFTRRAFEHGKLDLVEAEAVLGIIEAGSERAWRVAQTQLEGQLGRAIDRYRAIGTVLLAELEAGIDFPEEDVDYLRETRAGDRAAELERELAALVASFGLGRALREGLIVVLVGQVNAGKSSLFNALVGSERAVVTSEPGTTRDFVEAQVIWDGVPVTLVDTAGERAAATTEAEVRGMELGRARARAADVRIRIVAAPDWEGAVVSGPDLMAVSKGDLAPERVFEQAVVTSARTGDGLEALRAAVLERALCDATEAGEGVVLSTERQRAIAARAAEAYGRCREAIERGAAIEVIALEARTGLEALAEMRGERVAEDVLDALFARFCIGK